MPGLPHCLSSVTTSGSIAHGLALYRPESSGLFNYCRVLPSFVCPVRGSAILISGEFILSIFHLRVISPFSLFGWSSSPLFLLLLVISYRPLEVAGLACQVARLNVRSHHSFTLVCPSPAIFPEYAFVTAIG